MLKELGVNHYGIIGDPKARRVMIVVSKKKISVMDKLGTLENPNLNYLLRKITRRFMADIFKALRHDFHKM